MSMLGKVEDLVPLVHPRSRLRRGLELLQDCVAGRLPEVVNQVSSLPPGETSRVSLEGRCPLSAHPMLQTEAAGAGAVRGPRTSHRFAVSLEWSRVY